MKKHFHKLNNQGSTLLTVIICLALVGMLGSLMLSAAMSNLQMKMVESQSKKTFYSCEIAMEEIRTGLLELVADNIREVYEEEVLVNYASYLVDTDEARAASNSKIRNMVALRIIKALGNTNGFSSDAEILNATYESKPITPKLSVTGEVIPVLEDYLYLSSTSGTVRASFEAVNRDVDGTSVTIKGINVEYEENDYRTSITSDIRVNIPDFAFVDGTQIIHYLMAPIYPGYVLATDGGIYSENMGGSNEFTGSVYAGDNGINISGRNDTSNHTVTFEGNDSNIVTRGNITVSDMGHLQIGSTSFPTIWANNLITNTTAGYPWSSTINTEMNINGTIIIKDDLTLEGLNSKVKLGGAYIGYTGAHSSKGSAIMINGSGSGLDLSDLNLLVLAGRAHVSVEDINLNKDADILTGESLGFKSNQRAYLVPGEFIAGINHNPVTEADYDPSNIPRVEFPDEGVLNYNNYVNSTLKYKIAAKQTGESILASTLRYYYFNFASGKSADEFMRDYYNWDNSNNKILDNTTPFKLMNITPPNGTVLSVGNIMTYNQEDGHVELRQGLSLDKLEDGTDRFADDAVLDSYISSIKLSDYSITGFDANKAISDLPALYSRISHLLSTTDDKTVYREADSTVSSSIIRGGIDYVLDIGQEWENRTSSNVQYFNDYLEGNVYDYLSQYVVLSENDVTLGKETIFNGVIVANGNVIIERDSEINGIIIATGDVLMGDGVIINGMAVATGEAPAAVGHGDIIVGNNVSVNGRLIATGTMSFGVGCRAIADETYLSTYFTSESEILQNIFRNAKTSIDYIEVTPASSLVDLTGLINYENWRKN